MPEFWKKKVLELPRWAWASMLVGGVLIGLYFRSHDSSKPESTEEPEGYLNSGNLMPPAAPIEGGGGGVAGVGSPPRYESSKPEPEGHWGAPGSDSWPPGQGPGEGPEIPESPAPEEPVVDHPSVTPTPPPVINDPIKAPSRHPHIGEQVALPPRTPATACPAGTRANIEKARSEINRLQNEINGLQNHIAQLTNVIQQYPHAQKRSQWEAERNQDRANIEGKRQEIARQQQIIANGKAQPGCVNA